MIAHSMAEQLRQIDRAVTTLTRSTDALLRATSEISLLKEVCDITVEMAGYRLAWIGYARPDEGRSVTAMAMSGVAADYVSEVSVSWGDNDLGRGPTGTAIRTGVAQVIRDTDGDARFTPWREAALRYGFNSSIALPLGHGDSRLGALMIYAAEHDAFDSDTIRVLEDLARNLSYGIGALRMKAEHDQAVRDLAESEERYRSLIEMSPDAILVHSQGNILFANRASAGVFAAAHAKLVGRRIEDFFPEEARPDLLRRIANPPPGRFMSEETMLRLDDTPFSAEIVANSITFHGLNARLVVIRDVSERHQVQRQLLESAKLATLGEMAAGLVHELSQPLNIMRLTAEGALMFIERGKATPHWQAQQFQLIADQAQRTAEIIDDIRIFSRRDTSPIQVFDAMQAVRAALGVLEGQFRPDGIKLKIDLPATQVPVRGRRVQLEQVVMNLLSNAHHAVRDRRDRMPADWCGVVSITAELTGGTVRVTLADNGTGIPTELRSRIFEPFFTTKEAGRGTGLGLSVSFGIVDSMGGRLETVDGGEGACFRLTLPIDSEGLSPAPVLPPQPSDAIAPGDAHLMVVDDERAAAEALGGFLRELGYRVSVATSGAQAWGLFCADPADVVITDLRMPAGGGEQLVEKLRDFDPLLPIIIVTGHLGATERLAANLEDDRCAVLRKPVALGRLGELVTIFLRPPEE
jgi:PAS domain S-box-containing protein